MTLTVNNVNMIPYIAYQGIKWQRSDVDGANSGRTQSAVMIRDRIATKIRLDVTCTPLKKADASTVLNAIQSEYVTVTYDDPLLGTRTVTMYSNNVPATFCKIDSDGTEWWMGISFPLIER